MSFDITVPSGYPNASATIVCDKDFEQPSVGVDPDFSCSIAALTGQSISKNGSIFIGSAAVGTVKSFTTPSWLGTTVQSDTSRVVEFQVEIPSGYANSGTLFNCSKTLTQPATVGDCGTNEFYISTGKQSPGDFCDNTYSASALITSTSSSITGLMGSKICNNGTPFNGRGLYYGVLAAYAASGIGVGVGDFYVIQIDTTGVVLSVEIHTCRTGGSGTGSIIL